MSVQFIEEIVNLSTKIITYPKCRAQKQHNRKEKHRSLRSKVSAVYARRLRFVDLNSQNFFLYGKQIIAFNLHHSVFPFLTVCNFLYVPVTSVALPASLHLSKHTLNASPRLNFVPISEGKCIIADS